MAVYNFFMISPPWLCEKQEHGPCLGMHMLLLVNIIKSVLDDIYVTKKICLFFKEAKRMLVRRLFVQK